MPSGASAPLLPGHKSLSLSYLDPLEEPGSQETC